MMENCDGICFDCEEVGCPFRDDTTDSHIECIGIDNRRHMCLPDADRCNCGVAIRRKKLLRDDYKLYSCYGCTY